MPPHMVAFFLLLDLTLGPIAYGFAAVPALAGLALSLGLFFLGRWVWSKVNNEAAETPLKQSTVWKIYWKAAVGVWFVLLIVMAAALQRKPPRPGDSTVLQLMTINTAEIRYLSSHNGSYGDITDLISAGLLDERFRGSIGGYTFSVSASGNDYTATAIPASKNSGRYGYYMLPNAVVRYATSDSATCSPCYPPGQSGQPAY